MSHRSVSGGALFAVFSGHIIRKAVRAGALLGLQLPCPEVGQEFSLDKRELGGPVSIAVASAGLCLWNF